MGISVPMKNLNWVWGWNARPDKKWKGMHFAIYPNETYRETMEEIARQNVKQSDLNEFMIATLINKAVKSQNVMSGEEFMKEYCPSIEERAHQELKNYWGRAYLD